MEKIIEGFLCIMLFIVIALIWAIATALPIYFLWNWLMPEIFGLCKLTIIQAFGVSLLSGLLFGKTTVKSNE
ncbi:MAG: hypothetical protein Q4G33_06490 [bacterium]|nr:hypothetical protein [bacterium]